MNHTTFFAAIKGGTLSGVYLLEGTEEYIKQQALARLCAKLLPIGLEQMNLTDLQNPDADSLMAAAETLPFLGEKRVVVVRECDLLTSGRKQENEDKAEALLAYLDHMSPSTCLVFTVKGKADGRKKLYTYLKKRDVIVDFSPMSDGEAQEWARRSMKALGKQMDGETAAFLIFTVGRDAALLRQEMDKLAGYAGEREAVTARDIEVCTKSLECGVSDGGRPGGRQERGGLPLLSDMEHGGGDAWAFRHAAAQCRTVPHALPDGERCWYPGLMLGIPPCHGPTGSRPRHALASGSLERC